MEQVYADQIKILSGNSKYTMALMAGIIDSNDAEVIILMPPAIMKQLAIVARRVVKFYERNNGEIKFTEEEFKLLEIAPEDW